MDTEISPFESSEMLASFLASTPLLEESWRLCDRANSNPGQAFVMEQVGSTVYVAFSGMQYLIQGSEPSFGNLVALDVSDKFLAPLYHRSEEEEPVMVHAGLLNLFLSSLAAFESQMSSIREKSKSIVITGHSIGGGTASLAALWLLSLLQSESSSLPVLCITFGSPLLGNESLSHAIARERWGGNFCHVVSKHDLMPRLLFVPLASVTSQLRCLLQFWHLSMQSPQCKQLADQLNSGVATQIFQDVSAYLGWLTQAEGGSLKRLFWPFGNFFFCSEEGAICIENPESVIKMMHLMLVTSSPSRSIEDHLKYGDYVGKISLQVLNKTNFMQGDTPESSYETGVALALQSVGMLNQEPVAITAKDCLKKARRMGLTPSLNCAKLAIKLSKINPYRAEIEWYKACCDASDDQLGYYDAFKQRRASKRDSKVNMNRHKLARFWDNIIEMLDKNQLPHDFHRRHKWVNGSQFYMLLVEPLDIAEYYRTQMHRSKGHYIRYGRERRYKIFESWWKNRKVTDEESKQRSKFASATQDTCFWAKVEEARDWLDKVRSENDPRKLAELWESIDRFEMYSKRLVERMEVSIDVLAKNSSYTLWMEDYKRLKSQMHQLPPQFPSLMDVEVVPLLDDKK